MAEREGFDEPWQDFSGPNLAYIHDMYERYTEDPASVDESLRNLFEQWGAPPSEQEYATEEEPDDMASLNQTIAAKKLVQNIRNYGHLASKIQIFEEGTDQIPELLRAEKYGLQEEDLKALPASLIWSYAPKRIQTGLDAISELYSIYTGTTAYQFSHVNDPEERTWLNRIVEMGAYRSPLSDKERIALLYKLIQVEAFEQFLHRTFVGQKRFSIEGLEMMVPMLIELILEGVKDEAKNVLIGMAHRGRLNVLAHVLGKPYEIIFSEFHHAPDKELVPSEGSMGINEGWTGDVKYHLGAMREIKAEDSIRAKIKLANNPSHLEFVNPVVEGFTRAVQDDRSSPGFPELDVSKAFTIIIHGDAAFPGEGVVAETLNLSQLRGYRTGGTIHLIANNNIGFTTNSSDARSTKYASDLAKGFEIPIVHVNASDPEACLQAICLAYEYRKKFKKDFLIDLIGYRRYGHNEMDDPLVTQPTLYAKINQYPGVRSVYGKKLIEKGLLTPDQIKEKEIEIQSKFKKAYDKLKSKLDDENETTTPPVIDQPPRNVDTKVPLSTLKEINGALLKWPEGFYVYPKLEKILKRRATALEDQGKIDWALAETLAFATILADGTPIRLTGQDTERGTFAHRHLVLHDQKTGEAFSPLHAFPQAKASFAIYNSPLSEAAVMGFEYGYNVIAKDTLVLWEAQFGDFVNAAQVMIDQFLSAGRAKWGEISSLVLLLPHGYEGQGPEHSSARLERFLQLAAENNWTVANLTSPAQYFHLLRKQAAKLGTEEARPLIIMSPKSLIRHPRVISKGKDLSEKAFQPILEQPHLGQQPKAVEHIIFCSGKIAIDIEEELEAEHYDKERIHLIRIEQLYPFPAGEVSQQLKRYPRLKEIIWVQEEPQNMGAWFFIEPALRSIIPQEIDIRYVGRPERSSPAVGESNIHKVEQNQIVTNALQVAHSEQVASGGKEHD